MVRIQMKKRFIAYLLTVSLFLLILNNVPFIKPAFAAETLSGLTVGQDEIVRLTDRIITMQGQVVVEKNGVLILDNATITMDLSSDNQYNVTIRDEGQLKVVRRSFVSLPARRTRWFNINFEGNSTGELNNLIMRYGRVILKNSSVVTANTLQMNPGPGHIITQGSSKLTIANSYITPPTSFPATLPSRYRVSLVLEDSSTVYLARTTVVATPVTLTNNFATYDFSNLYISDNQALAIILGTIKARDNSKVIVSNSSKTPDVQAYDLSSVFVLGLDMKSAEAHDSSTISIIRTQLTSLKAFDSSLVLLNGVKATSLQASGTAHMKVMDSTVIYSSDNPAGGNVEAHDSSQVQVFTTTMNEAAVYGSSQLYLANSTVDWILRSSSSSSLSLVGSKVSILTVDDLSSATLSKSTISVLNAKESSKVYVTDSSIEELAMYLNSANASFWYLSPVLYGKWSLFGDVSLALNVDGQAPDLRLAKTRITKGWSLLLTGTSNITVTESALIFLSAYDSVTMQLVNSAVKSTDIKSEAKIYVYSYLDVFALNRTNVMVFYNGAQVGPTQTTDGVNPARFTLLERTVNASATAFQGAYTMSASFDGSSEQRTVQIAGYQSINLIPPPPLWEQLRLLLLDFVTGFWYLIIIVVAAAFVILILFRRRKREALSLE